VWEDGKEGGRDEELGTASVSEVGLSWWPLNRIVSSKKPVTSVNGNAKSTLAYPT